jgi:hypothetical protein
VDSWTVQLIAYGTRSEPARYHRLILDPSTFSGELTGAALRDAVGDSASVVAAIVTQNDPDEDSPAQATYQLEVNTVAQPGGSGQVN